MVEEVVPISVAALELQPWFEAAIVVLVLVEVVVDEEEDVCRRPVKAAQTRTMREGLLLLVTVLLLFLEADRYISLGNVDPRGGSYPMEVGRIGTKGEGEEEDGLIENRWNGWTVVAWCKLGIPYILRASVICAATCGSAVGLIMPPPRLLPPELLLLPLPLSPCPLK
jgi:hypothetical protein